MVLAVAVLEASATVIWHTFATFHDALRAVALSWALFMYSLAAINAVAILVGVTTVAPMQVGAPGLIAILAGFGFLVYEGLRMQREARVGPDFPLLLPSPVEQTASLSATPTNLESPPSPSLRMPAEVNR
jgi:hypothetical protein